MDARKITSRHRNIARLFCAACKDDRVVIHLQIGNRAINADIDVVMENDAFAFHLLYTTVDEMLFQFEIGNAITQQATRLGVFLIDMHFMPGACELLGGGKTCGA